MRVRVDLKSDPISLKLLSHTGDEAKWLDFIGHDGIADIARVMWVDENLNPVEAPSTQNGAPSKLSNNSRYATALEVLHEFISDTNCLRNDNIIDINNWLMQRLNAEKDQHCA